MPSDNVVNLRPSTCPTNLRLMTTFSKKQQLYATEIFPFSFSEFVSQKCSIRAQLSRIFASFAPISSPWRPPEICKPWQRFCLRNSRRKLFISWLISSRKSANTLSLVKGIRTSQLISLRYAEAKELVCEIISNCLYLPHWSRQRWGVAAEKKIQLPNTLPIVFFILFI